MNAANSNSQYGYDLSKAQALKGLPTHALDECNGNTIGGSLPSGLGSP